MSAELSKLERVGGTSNLIPIIIYQHPHPQPHHHCPVKAASLTPGL